MTKRLEFPVRGFTEHQKKSGEEVGQFLINSIFVDKSWKIHLEFCFVIDLLILEKSINQSINQSMEQMSHLKYHQMKPTHLFQPLIH
jgi:hypothetical protein